MERIDNAQLKALLHALIEDVSEVRPVTGSIFALLISTGLRIREVLEVTRWRKDKHGDFAVQLEKKEGLRSIKRSSVPSSIWANFDAHLPFQMETYSAVNNTFKYYGPGLIFGEDTRRTTCHAFRYLYMKTLSADGFTVAQIAAKMGHINLNNTLGYIQADIWAAR